MTSLQVIWPPQTKYPGYAYGVWQLVDYLQITAT